MKNRYYFFITIFSILLSLLTINRLNSEVGLPSLGHDIAMVILLFIVSILIIISPKSNSFQVSKRLNALVIAISFSMLPISIFSVKSTEFVSAILVLISLPLSFILGKKICSIFHAFECPSIMLTIILLPALVGFIWIFTMSSKFSLYAIGRDYIFSVIIFLPFIYFFRSSLIKFILILLFLFVALDSTKRTAVIIATVSLVLYIVLNFGQLKRNKLIYIAAIIAVFSLPYIKINLQSNESFEIAFERLQNFDDESNEIRTDVYSRIINEVQEANIFEIFFGHGYNAITKDLFGHPAHNDYLEIIYDYGLVAFILYLIFVLTILFYAIKQVINFKGHRYDAYPILNSIVLFIILNMFNCILINVVYIFVCTLVIGWSYQYTKIRCYEHKRI